MKSYHIFLSGEIRPYFRGSFRLYDELVSQLGKRRWRVMGDPEDGWWVEVDSDGSELPGDWEYDRKGGYVYCSFS